MNTEQTPVKESLTAENTTFDLEWAKRGGVVVGKNKYDHTFIGKYLTNSRREVELYDYKTGWLIWELKENYLRMATRAECDAAGVEYIEPPLNSEDKSAMLVIAHLNGYEAGKKNAEARIKELEDGIRNLLDIHLQGVDKPAKSVWERKLNVAIHRLSKLIGIES